MKEIIFLNEKFVTSEEAKISALSEGFLYGWGLFETMRAVGQKIIYFNRHLERIKASAKLIYLGFPYSLDKLKAMIKQAVQKSGFNDAYLRLTISKSGQGLDTLVAVKKYQPYSAKKYQQGFSACISSLRQIQGSFLTQIKTTNYLLPRLSYQEARDKGFDEAIILNNHGYLVEASRSNLFLVKDNQLFTPALDCGCLAGITRRAVFDLAKKYRLKLYQGKFTPDDLSGADEAFLTNSLVGIMPLAGIEKRVIGKNKCRKVTGFLIKKYRCLLK